jgi:hypothetical protein
VAWASKDMTLLPGTIIMTGTPEGIGAAMDPPRFMVRAPRSPPRPAAPTRHPPAAATEAVAEAVAVALAVAVGAGARRRDRVRDRGAGYALEHGRTGANPGPLPPPALRAPRALRCIILYFRNTYQLYRCR